jgi:3-phenylpropionate/trans-cinnamate dioxygenase ferredoxin subunit
MYGRPASGDEFVMQRSGSDEKPLGFWTRGGVLAAAAGIDRPKELRVAKALIEAKLRPPAAVLADSATDLRGLLRGLVPLSGPLKWVLVCESSALIEDEGFRMATSPPVSIFLSAGELFCVDDTCTHETYSLADGWVENCVVECALHMAKFDLRTGAVLSPPATDRIRVHEVRVQDGEVFVRIPATYRREEMA